MSLRRLIVEVDPAELNVSEFCRRHDLSTWFFYDLRRRFARDGEAALEPRSRAPKVVANKTPPATEDQIVALRKELADEGLDHGPDTIAFHLGQRSPGAAVPSPSTVWRVLVRRGFVVPDPSKKPNKTYRSFAAERANECWQIDDTAWWLADGTEVKIINLLDDYSRLAVASQAVTSCTAAAALAAFMVAAAVWGWPARFLSDNARAFRGPLARALAALGVVAGHSRPYHPQTCGKVERFHQTLKKFLAAQDPAGSLEELQVQLDAFLEIYNRRRPHRALDRRFPAAVWADAPKSGPANRPLHTPTEVHYGTVYNGLISIGGRYLISVGAVFTGQPVTTVITGNACHVFSDGVLIRQLTIDPTRRVQRLRPREPLA